MTLRDIQPYETLKSRVDEAQANFREKLDNLVRNINHQDGPMLLLIDVEELYKAHAVLVASIDAYTREYGHMAEVNENLRKQRDDANRKLESFKRTLNQLNMDEDDNGSNGDTAAANKGRKRRK